MILRVAAMHTVLTIDSLSASVDGTISCPETDLLIARAAVGSTPVVQQNRFSVHTVLANGKQAHVHIRCAAALGLQHLSVVLRDGAKLTLPNGARFRSITAFLDDGSELRCDGVAVVENLQLINRSAEPSRCSNLLVTRKLYADENIQGSVQHQRYCAVLNPGQLQVLAVLDHVAPVFDPTTVFADCCVICQDDIAEYTSHECSHAIVCQKCRAIDRLLGQPCPKCRRPVKTLWCVNPPLS